METNTRYLRNSWYAAAWGSEVQAGKLFARTLLDEPVLLYRDSQGVAHAISDRCPHRFVPLHLGCLKGDEVQCGYHGLRFDGTGACTHNPHGDGTIPRAARVKSWPLVERYSVLWIWMGASEEADPDRIPDFTCMDAGHFWVGKGYLHAKVNYALATDNIMDLSHVEYLHPATLGGDSVKHAIISIEEQGNTVWSNRQTVAEIMTDFLYQQLNIPVGTPVDRWFDVRWDAPANMLLRVGATPTGQPRSEGRGTTIPHLFTPETGKTTHYWFAVCFPRAMGPIGERLANEEVKALTRPFASEDLPMLQAQQDRVGDAGFWSLKPVLLAGDAGAVRARRILDRLIAQERAAEVAHELTHEA